MRYEPKRQLARGLDGFSRPRGYSGWRLAGMGVSLILVVWTMAYLGGQAEAPARKAERKQGGAAPEAGDAALLFRDMSFLKQVKRTAAPRIFLKTLDGQNHSLEQHAGKIVLINFWATWCQPCVREMPSMERLYQKHKARGLEIVAVSLDQGGADAVREFAAKLRLTFPIVLDPGHEAKERYRVRGLPTTYLVDRRGRVAGYGVGPREWDEEAAYALVGHLLDEKS